MAIADYCGAGAHLEPGKALSLRGWRWQPKVDGVYARVTTDAAGQIVRVLARSSRPIATDLVGCRTPYRSATLHGELESHTEAGLAAASRRGYSLLHLFDASQMDGRPIARETYTQRRHLLWTELARGEGDLWETWHLDASGRAHDGRGRFCAAVPRDHRRLRIVPQVATPAQARELWDDYVVRGGGEGIVAVRPDAPLRARGAKRKVKARSTLDAFVVAVDASAARLEHRGHLFEVSARGKVRPQVGDLVEVAHDGWYAATVTPRFPRIVRVREDLIGPTAGSA